VAALVSGPILYGLFQRFAGNVHFLIQVAVTLQLVLAIMGLMTFWRPLKEPKSLPERKDIESRTEPVVILCGVGVIAAVVAFFVAFR